MIILVKWSFPQVTKVSGMASKAIVLFIKEVFAFTKKIIVIVITPNISKKDSSQYNRLLELLQVSIRVINGKAKLNIPRGPVALEIPPEYIENQFKNASGDTCFQKGR